MSVASIVTIASFVAAAYFAGFRFVRTTVGVALGSVVLVVVLQLAGVPVRVALWAQAAVAVALLAFVGGMHALDTRAWRSEQKDPLVLEPPFAGRWRVVAGGPARRNHHRPFRDQRYAYDFIRVDDDSWETEIRAPIGGIVAFARDGAEDRKPRRGVYDEREAPFGN